METPLCRGLGIRYPIFSVGFGIGAGPELVSAVSNAGACGVLGSAGMEPAYLRQRIRHVRTLTEKLFGVNIVFPFMREGTIEMCFDERVPLLVLFWGDPAPYVVEAHRLGIKVFLQVGSVDEAKSAAEAGVDAVIAQGFEAGGHVRGRTSLSVFLPSVVEVIKPLPVVAAGGIADGRGVVAALSLGAQGVSIGTRFVASDEAFVPREYKERVARSTAEDTVYSTLFDGGWPNAPHRTLRNRVVEEWEAAGRPPSGERPGEGTVIGTVSRAGAIRDVQRYYAIMVTPEFTGSIEYVPLWAGESCSLVNEIKPAAQIVGDIVREAEEVISQARP